MKIKLQQETELTFTSCPHIKANIMQEESSNGRIENNSRRIRNNMDLAFGKEFSGKLLYVQYVDPNLATVHEMADAFLKDFIVDVKPSAPNYTQNALLTRYSNIDILKSALSDEIVNVRVYTCPMEGYPKPLLHAYAVFQTQDKEKREMWWSFDKNGHHIVLQQSRKEEDAIKKIYDDETKETMKRTETVEKEISAKADSRSLESLLRILCDTYQLGESYHLFLSNCWNFASFVFNNTNSEKKEWQYISMRTLRNRIRNSSTPVNEQHEQVEVDEEEHQNGILITGIGEVNGLTEKILLDWIDSDGYKIEYYLALIQRRDMEEFKRVIGRYKSDTIDKRDSQGYNLLEWAEAFSRDDDVKEHLIEKGADKSELQRQNVFFIALQYVDSQDELNDPKLSFEGIDINGVNLMNDTALHLALNGGKWKVASKILKLENQSIPVDAVNRMGETALHVIAKLTCHIQTFEEILKRFAQDKIDTIDKQGYAPLHWAIHARSLDKIKELLKKEAQVKLAINDNQGLSPLHLAVQRWSNSPDNRINKIFNLLVEEHKADIQAEDKKGNSVLNTAIQLKSAKFAELLLGKGANTTAENGTMSLHLAVQWPECPKQLLKKILQKSTTDIQVRIKHDALHCALKSQSPNACKMLLEEKEIDVNTATKDGEIALHLAAKWPNIEDELFKKILKNTSDINKMDRNGRTPLYYALMFKSVTATEKLLKNEATVNAGAQTYDNYTALHLAAYFWSDIPLETFEKILKKEKDKINNKDKYGRTALHCAIESKSVFLVEKLLDSNADASIVGVDDVTPLHLAAQWKLKYSPLPESQRNPNQSYVMLSDYKRDESSSDITPNLFNKILNKSSGAINSKNKYGETALHLALYSHSKTATDALLKHPELDVNIKDIHGKTALDYARESESPPEIINLLQNAMDRQQ